MLLTPKRSKFKKYHSRKKINKIVTLSDQFFFGSSGLVATEAGFVASRHLESARLVLRRKLKKQARIWTRVFPYIATSKKPIGVRMGKGKGPQKYWVARVSPGQLLFELAGSNKTCFSSLKLAIKKLPLKTVSSKRNARWTL